MAKDIIEVSRFTKTYDDFKAVDDISFAVEEGSIFAFLGPNGAGKSTTINTLCTMLDKTEGELILNGHDVTKEKDKVRADIGIVFQESILDSNLTIYENLKLHCDFYNVPKAEVRDRIDFALGLVDLTDWKKASIKSLSGGMKRRVEIARGLVHFPKVLFLDEPTTGLDPQTRANIWDYIRRLQKEKNITIFLTTHYMDEAEICDKVAVIDHGKIAAYDTPYNLKKQYTTSTVKMALRDDKAFIDYLDKRSIDYKQDDGMFVIHLKDIGEILDTTAKFKDDIVDFEVRKGTLNEVFLAITGKEVRL